MTKVLKIKNLGEVKKFLGWEIERKNNYFEVHQYTYIDKLLKNYEMFDCESLTTPIQDDDQEIKPHLPIRELVGSLLYLLYKSRPDISSTVQILSRNIHRPTDALMNACRNVLRYLSGTKNYRLQYGNLINNKNNIIQVYTYAWHSDKPVSDEIISYESPIFWPTRKISKASGSSASSELYAIVEGLKELMWINYLISDLGIEAEKQLLTDNQPEKLDIMNGPNKRSHYLEIYWAKM